MTAHVYKHQIVEIPSTILENIRTQFGYTCIHPGVMSVYCVINKPCISQNKRLVLPDSPFPHYDWEESYAVRLLCDG